MSLGNFLDDITDTLKELSIDYGTIEAILKSLSDLQDDVPGDDTFTAPAATSFGTLPAGVRLGFHTDNAHTFLGDSLKEMLSTLGLFDEGIRLFRQGTNRTDEFTRDQLNGINKVLQQANNITHRDRDGDL